MTTLYKKIVSELKDEISRVEETWNIKIESFKTKREILVALKTIEMVLNKRHQEIDKLSESEELLFIDLYNSLYINLRTINNNQTIDDIREDYFILLKDYKKLLSFANKK